ncbi:MAG: hypothetical protein KJ668_05165, partial [Proteobacteria bacterium]|nr:hypothetical protein [Pseudomonadota bacterium]
QENFKLKPIEDVITNEKEKPDRKEGTGPSNEIDEITQTVKESIETEDTTRGDFEIFHPDSADYGLEKDNFFEDQKESQSDEREAPDSIFEPRRQPQGKPKLMELFAKAQGYVKQSDDNVFIHGNGSRIEWVSGSSFPWEKYSASGELMQCYWIKNHCIERSPLQIDADVWELCIKYPNKYTLILSSLDGTPSEYSGMRICDLKDNGRLTLFSASFRIVYDHDT